MDTTQSHNIPAFLLTSTIQLCFYYFKIAREQKMCRTGSAWRHGRMEVERLEKRFGVTAVKKGFITSDQLVEALAIQVAEDIATGDHDLVGKILFKQGIITMEQIDAILEAMGKIPD